MRHVERGVGYDIVRIGGKTSLVMQDQETAGLVHPFKVSAFKDGNDIKVRVRAGTANNLVPTMSGTELDDSPAPTLTLAGNATHRIYLKAEIGATPVFFPDTLSVVTATSVQTDTNDEGYLLLGSVVVADGKVTAVNQYVYASQVVVRAKPGSATALWSWSSR
jgi:hypothetical protein